MKDLWYNEYTIPLHKERINMKKWIKIIAVFLIAMAAYFGIVMYRTERISIGIIGGADGPTAIFVGSPQY